MVFFPTSSPASCVSFVSSFLLTIQAQSATIFSIFIGYLDLHFCRWALHIPFLFSFFGGFCSCQFIGALYILQLLILVSTANKEGKSSWELFMAVPFSIFIISTRSMVLRLQSRAICQECHGTTALFIFKKQNKTGPSLGQVSMPCPTHPNPMLGQHCSNFSHSPTIHTILPYPLSHVLLFIVLKLYIVATI